MPAPIVTGSAIGGAPPSFDPPAGSDLLIVFSGASPEPTITWRGDNLTTIQTVASFFSEVHLLARGTPGTGSATPGGVTGNTGILSLDGVDATPIASSGTGSGSGTSVSVSVSPTADQLVVWGYVENGPAAGATVSAGANTTVQQQTNSNYYVFAVGTATGTINITTTLGNDWRVVYAIVNGAGGGAASAATVVQQYMRRWGLTG